MTRGVIDPSPAGQFRIRLDIDQVVRLRRKLGNVDGCARAVVNNLSVGSTVRATQNAFQARAGKEALSYPWGDKIEAAKARFNVETGPAPVGQFPANDFGLFDMSGNVSEWCSDWFDREYYQSSPARNPKGPETGIYKVIRGGAWSDEAARVTVFFRNWVRPTQTTPNIGFRCASSAGE